MLPPKARSRYLPTLTHVVTQEELNSIGTYAEVVERHPVAVEPETLVKEVLELLIPSAMARMRDEMQANLETQLRLIEEKLRSDVETTVLQVLNDTVAKPGP